MIRITELKSNQGTIAKQYKIAKDGTFKVNSAATIYNATATPTDIEVEDVASYLDSLTKEHSTCLTLGVCGDSGVDYPLTTVDKVKEGTIARTQDFFSYANSGATNLMLLDFDSDASDEVRMTFLRELDVILSDALIGEKGYERTTIQKWLRPSSSASAKINGKVGNGLHVFIPVKGLTEDLIPLIHRWCFLQKYGSGHRMTKAGTILSESLIDSAVNGPERVVYTSDAITSGDGLEDFYEHVHRPCTTVPGGVLDCQTACQILTELTVDYNSQWMSYKKRAEASQEVIDARNAWKQAQIEKKVQSGVPLKEARRAVKQLSEGVLLSSEELLRCNGETVLVSEILTDPDTWVDKDKFTSPVARDMSRNVCKVLRRTPESNPFLNCLDHGGIKYALKWTYEDLLTWTNEADEDEVEENASHFLHNSVCSNIQQGKIMKALSKRLSVPVADIKADVKETFKSSSDSDDAGFEPTSGSTTLSKEATHVDIINDYIFSKGDCKGYGDGLFTYNSVSGVWDKLSANYIQKDLGNKYNHVQRCMRVSDYQGIAKSILNEDTISVTEWKPVPGIPCSDGFYKVTDKGVEKVPYTKELGCRFKLGFKPDYSMPTPNWQRVIDNVDNEILFQQLFGLCLSGYLVDMQKAFVMQGVGGSGKGTTDSVMSAMLPKRQITAVSLDKLNDPKFLLPLVDSRVNIISEVSSNKMLDLTGFKAVVGGDAVAAWQLFVGQKTFRPNCSFVLNLNQWPKLSQVGPEIKRRLGDTIVKFSKNHEGQIDGLSQAIIDNELPGVLAWCLEGIEHYFNDGLWNETSLKHYEDWTNAINPVTLFFTERVKFEDGAYIKQSDFWRAYVAFCSDSEYFPGNKGTFLGQVKDMPGVSEGATNGFATLRGIKVKV